MRELTGERFRAFYFTGEELADLIDEAAVFIRTLDKRQRLLEIKPILDDEGWNVTVIISEDMGA